MRRKISTPTGLRRALSRSDAVRPRRAPVGLNPSLSPTLLPPLAAPDGDGGECFAGDLSPKPGFAGRAGRMARAGGSARRASPADPRLPARAGGGEGVGGIKEPFSPLALRDAHITRRGARAPLPQLATACWGRW